MTNNNTKQNNKQSKGVYVQCCNNCKHCKTYKGGQVVCKSYKGIINDYFVGRNCLEYEVKSRYKGLVEENKIVKVKKLIAKYIIIKKVKVKTVTAN